ncbi:hypothetical protein [Herbaspirillum chlorophenolicum]|uniref:hypothetical protein n=1 Tax=Herbaspirillum chlorophenolicum TaxID=211589 RepID=UPI00067B1787|nr:hypothetical protein [Herbaspirillum chlorophenolicum]
MESIFLRGPSETAAEFPRVRHLFERVTNEAAKGEFTVQDLERLAGEGRIIVGVALLANTPVLAVALEFIHYPQYTVMNVVALAGEQLPAVMQAFWPALREYAREAGATHIQASCSPAMARLLAKYGFEETYRTIRSKL